MKKKFALVAVLGLVAALALAMVGCGSSSSTKKATSAASATSAAAASASGSLTMQDGTLTVISSLDFPPFENLENGEAVGFEMDLIRALGDQMGLTVNIQNQAFDSLVPAIAAGSTADCSISGITITPEREEEVLFTDPVIDSNQSLVVLSSSSYTDAASLQGKTIAAQSGTTGSDWAKENIPNANVVDYQEATACFSALAAGQADAVSIDLPVASYTIRTAYSDCKIIQETPTGEQYGIAVNKNNPELVSALNDALAEIKANGTYDQIYNSWFTTN